MATTFLIERLCARKTHAFHLQVLKAADAPKGTPKSFSASSTRRLGKSANTVCMARDAGVRNRTPAACAATALGLVPLFTMGLVGLSAVRRSRTPFPGWCLLCIHRAAPPPLSTLLWLFWTQRHTTSPTISHLCVCDVLLRLSSTRVESLLHVARFFSRSLWKSDDEKIIELCRVSRHFLL